MDGPSFDRFAKGLAGGSTTRRGFMRGVFRRGASVTVASIAGAAAIGAVQPEVANAAGTCPGDKVPTGCACEAGLSECANDTCKDLQSDEQNCGSCSNVCGANEVCDAGVCTCPSGDYIVCDGECVNWRDDVNHCGRCDHACPDPNMICSAWAVQNPFCECPGAEAWVWCPSIQACAHISTDENHCGACDRQCPADTHCGGYNGTSWECLSDADDLPVFLSGSGQHMGPNHCGSVSNMCDSNHACCDGVCIDLRSDFDNCGQCGRECPARDHSHCVSNNVMFPYTCVCDNGYYDCGNQCIYCPPGQSPQGQNCECGCPSSSPDYCEEVGCVDFQTNLFHCGECGKLCPFGTTCVSGECNCGPGRKACTTYCATLASDENHCGACGNVCPTGSSCNGGICTCPTGQEACGGACVTSCTGGKVFDGSCACVCPSGTTECGGSCVADCPSGQTLNTSTCTCECDAGTTMCSGSCVTDCPAGQSLDGSCQCVCDSGTLCGGSCISCDAGRTLNPGTCACDCDSGTTDCSDICVDTLTDNANCGGCGSPCDVGETCTAGVCV